MLLDLQETNNMILKGVKENNVASETIKNNLAQCDGITFNKLPFLFDFLKCFEMLLVTQRPPFILYILLDLYYTYYLFPFFSYLLSQCEEKHVLFTLFVSNISSITDCLYTCFNFL